MSNFEAAITAFLDTLACESGGGGVGSEHFLREMRRCAPSEPSKGDPPTPSAFQASPPDRGSRPFEHPPALRGGREIGDGGIAVAPEDVAGVALLLRDGRVLVLGGGPA